MIPVGTAKEGRMDVTEENTAASWGSGSLPVLATPAMILLIERTASECLQPLLQDGESTVGTSIQIEHTAPSVIGSEVFCRAEVIGTDRSKVVFKIEVWDSAGIVGQGMHERFVVNGERFMAKAYSRE